MGSKPQTPDMKGDSDCIEKSFINAKSYLLQTSTHSGLNLYDHLAEVLTRILDEKPENVVDVIEDLSKETKRSKFISDTDTVLNKADPSTEVALAEIQNKLFVKGENEVEEQLDEDAESPLPNLLRLAFNFEQAGIGLCREEIVRIWLALKNLVDTQPLQHVRFWGKIIGSEQNYIIAEAEFRDGEDEEEDDDQQDETVEEEEKEGGAEEEEEEDDTPKPDYKPPVVIPREDKGTGVNRKTYFVCNDPGKQWVRLPQVTPAQISVARKIKKYFTGRLEAPVVTYPPFPGNESNYLRAQISRISAGTHISPSGFYQFDEEEEEEEDGEGRDNFIENIEFEGIPARELADPSLANWAHHVQYILEQGRCKWFNPVQKNDDDFEDDEEEEDREEPDEPEPETGPPLLNPLSEDEDIDTHTRAWNTRMSSALVPQYAIAVVMSNRWPGAFAFGRQRDFENVYIGYGHKYSIENFSPAPPPPIQEEFPSGPEISEAEDPTPEEEAAYRAAQQEAAEAEEALEEEEDDEDEDD